MTMSFQEACGWLDGLCLFGIKLGLEQSRELADRCGAPDRGLKFLHIAGTNGKGSTGAMLEHALRGNGCVTGFYSSPHLISVRERIRVGGRAVGEEEFAAAANEVRTACEAMAREGKKPTYFEVMTVMALLVFRRRHCDWIVWETGMGGRLDATNIVVPKVSVITTIALDHQKYLGNTLTEIAGDKAGIVKPGVPVVIGATVPDEARRVIKTRAREMAAPVLDAGKRFPVGELRLNSDGSQSFAAGPHRITLALAGAMQRSNCQSVLAVLEAVGMLNAVSLAALAQTRWPGRAELCCRKRVLVDGGHNPEGLAALCALLRERWPDRKFRWVFGAFADKDYTGGLRLIAPLADSLEAVGFAEGSRLSAAPEEIVKQARELGIAECRADRKLPEILAETLRGTAEFPETPLIVGGSLYLAGEALALLREEERVLDL